MQYRLYWESGFDIALDASRSMRGGLNAEPAEMNVTMYHDPNRGTSRNELAPIRTRGVEPAMIERPIVVSPKAVRLCRPKERVLEILG
jgi:arsenate reductase-like glutaredoxin family protein